MKPILNNIDTIQLKNPKQHELLSIVVISVFWRDLITNILPPGENGLIVVFKNECNPSFTFEINGPDVVYVGQGDLHESEYDYLGQGVRFGSGIVFFFCLCLSAALT
jgi:hypothetical protein